MFRIYTVSVPIVATASVQVSAADSEAAEQLACEVVSSLESRVVRPFPQYDYSVLLDFEPDRDNAVAMSEEERTR